MSWFCFRILDTISKMRCVYADRFISFAICSYSATCHMWIKHSNHLSQCICYKAVIQQNIQCSSLLYSHWVQKKYPIHPKHPIKILYRSKHFSGRFKRKRDWVFLILNTVYFLTNELLPCWLQVLFINTSHRICFVGLTMFLFPMMSTTCDFHNNRFWFYHFISFLAFIS